MRKKIDKTDVVVRSPNLAEVKVSYKSKMQEVVKISSSRDAFNILFKLYDPDTIEFKEEFFMLLVNRANRLLGWFKLSSGGTTGTIVDSKIILVIALNSNAHGIVLCHNHPSGNLRPSDADISLTNKVRDASKLLEISLIDHLIISPAESYFSFADEGLI